METLTTAYLFGLSVAVPFGPISMMIVVNAVRGGPALALAVAFGSVTGGLLLATLILATVTVAGGAARRNRAAGSGTVVAVGIFAFLGVRQLRAALAHRTAVIATPRVSTPFSTALALALTNPLTVLPFLAFLTAVAPGAGTSLPFLPLVIATGQLTWYVALSLLGARLRPYLGRILPLLQVGASIVLFACGISLALQLTP